MKQLFLILYFLLPFISINANEFPFQAKEELKFDIHYKYGLVMLKAGTANFNVVEGSYNKKNSFQTSLDFKTTSFFDKIFKMRDTFYSHITENLQPLYHIRTINEGNYQFREEIFFNQFSTKYTEARIKRESKGILKFDTILTSNIYSYDILNLILYICSFDYSQFKPNQVETVCNFIGKEKVSVTIRYEGQSIVEKNDNLKYNTRKIALDFSDSNFNEAKSAVEIWISDDKNRIPIKIKAKLKIGAAEVHLSSWKNLKYPLTSEIKIPYKK